MSGRRWDGLRRVMPILLALLIGGAIGRWSAETGRFLAPFGSLYLSLLLMCVIPIIGAAVVSSLGRLVANHKLGKNLVVIVGVFWATAPVAMRTPASNIREKTMVFFMPSSFTREFGFVVGERIPRITTHVF